MKKGEHLTPVPLKMSREKGLQSPATSWELRFEVHLEMLESPYTLLTAEVFLRPS